MQTKKQYSHFGSLGVFARWGIISEEEFHDPRVEILEERFGAKVININEWDEEGFVFN